MLITINVRVADDTTINEVDYFISEASYLARANIILNGIPAVDESRDVSPDWLNKETFELFRVE
jgi:hypothetical protein